uniref:Mitochondrial import inner membrane translocase subunit n=1 Tax=Karlodinium veneficum TaxID=407301 RepID=A7YXW0_KARVE|nr:Tim10/DDP family zinc finger [Karlodinium veneficum]
MSQVAAGQPASPAELLVAEMKGMADCFARMTVSCYSKCISNVREEKLNVGEMSCVDRCVSKYLDVHARVGGELQNNLGQATEVPSVE